MAFGQQGGPPATARQVEELLALLHAAGHEGFRDARGPMGFTQRQGAGKFTRDEAQALIARLQDDGDGGAGDDDGDAGSRPQPARRLSQAEVLLRRMPAEQLAGELQRRGWLVVEP